MNEKTFPLAPLAGIDNASPRDDALVTGGDDGRRVFLREAADVTIEQGRASLRPGLRQISSAALRCLWQSPLHGDVFAAEGAQWVKVSPGDWSRTPLAEVGPGDVSHLVLNGQVLAATDDGIWRYNGQNAQRLTLERPAGPMVAAGAGSLVAGHYGVAVAWLRGALEGPLSAMTGCTAPADGALNITLPLCLDASVTGARLYLTRPDGGELLRAGDYPAAQTVVQVPLLPELGAPPAFAGMGPMPGGQYLALWRGRLVVARGSVLRLSEALAYHVHHPLHGFVQMPQRITFVAPVDAGLFVGQVDHVAFLRGADLQELALERRTAATPVAGSALELPAEDAGQAGEGARSVVAWLASNGFALGTPDGGIIEPHARRLQGIAGARGTCVVFGGRLAAAVT